MKTLSKFLRGLVFYAGEILIVVFTCIWAYYYVQGINAHEKLIPGGRKTAAPLTWRVSSFTQWHHPCIVHDYYYTDITLEPVNGKWPYGHIWLEFENDDTGYVIPPEWKPFVTDERTPLRLLPGPPSGVSYYSTYLDNYGYWYPVTPQDYQKFVP